MHTFFAQPAAKVVAAVVDAEDGSGLSRPFLFLLTRCFVSFPKLSPRRPSLNSFPLSARFPVHSALPTLAYPNLSFPLLSLPLSSLKWLRFRLRLKLGRLAKEQQEDRYRVCYRIPASQRLVLSCTSTSSMTEEREVSLCSGFREDEHNLL